MISHVNGTTPTRYCTRCAQATRHFVTPTDRLAYQTPRRAHYTCLRCNLYAPDDTDTEAWHEADIGARLVRRSERYTFIMESAVPGRPYDYTSVCIDAWPNRDNARPEIVVDGAPLEEALQAVRCMEAGE